jgi:hypothetical protein
MKSISWFNTGGLENFGEIANKLMSRKYSEVSGKGFVVSKFDDKEIVAKFIEKKPVSQVVVDPLGNTQEYIRIEYYVVDFRVFSLAKQFITIKQQPRTIKPFIAYLADIFPLGFYVENIKTPPNLLLSKLESKLGNATVTLFECSGINIENVSKAKMLFKGTTDIRPSVEHFLQNKKYKVNKIGCFFSESNNASNIELNSHGVIRYDSLSDVFIKNELEPLICV